MSKFKIFNVRGVSRGTLACTFDLTLPSGLLIYGVMLHKQSGGKSWIGFPSKEWLNGDKRAFSPLIGFSDLETRELFQGQVLPLALSAFAEMGR
jgi:hypothetical protein